MSELECLRDFINRGEWDYAGAYADAALRSLEEKLRLVHISTVAAEQALPAPFSLRGTIDLLESLLRTTEKPSDE